MPTRRKARIRSTEGSGGLSHLDLENLVIALLAGNGDAWPNALYAAGYRFQCYDAPVPLLEQGPDGVTGRSQKAPDAVAWHAARNLILVLECKEGTSIGLSQIPEGRNAGPDEWASALSLPRNPLVPVNAHGMLVAETEVLEPKVNQIEEKKASWLRVDPSGFRLDPNHQSDERLAAILGRLPSDPWPRSFVPFSGDPSPDTKSTVIANIGPLILEAARKGEPYVTAKEIVRQTHRAVFDMTCDKTQSGWVTVVNTVLAELAAGALRSLATYSQPLRRLQLQGIRQGIPATPSQMSAIDKALVSAQRRSQSRRSRVPAKRSAGAQLGLWEEDDL